MKPFAGFPARPQYTGIPALFFSAVLPQIDDLAELKVTLHVFWLLAHKPGSDRAVAEDELLADRTLMAGMAACPSAEGAAAALRQGLDRAVARGTLLRGDGRRQGQRGAPSAEPVPSASSGQALSQPKDSGRRLYFVNSEAGRRARDRAQGEAGALAATPGPEPAPAEPPPNIYQLYEEHVGVLAPLVAEKLKDLEAEYPEAWIAEAIKLAVERNSRRLSYIEGILKRWRDEGRDHGEPGRHPEEDDYARAWEQFRARRGR